MSVSKKITKAMDAGYSALKYWFKGDKRKTLYYLDHVKDDIQAAIYLLLAEIEEDETDK